MRWGRIFFVDLQFEYKITATNENNIKTET